MLYNLGLLCLSIIPISLLGVWLKMVNNHATMIHALICMLLTWIHTVKITLQATKSCCNLCYYSTIYDFWLETKMNLWCFYWIINTENVYLHPLISTEYIVKYNIVNIYQKYSFHSLRSSWLLNIMLSFQFLSVSHTWLLNK